MMRMMLYEAALSMLTHTIKWSWLKASGDEDRQAPRDEEGGRGPGASPGRNHAPHMGGRHRVPVDQGNRKGMRPGQDQRP